MKNVLCDDKGSGTTERSREADWHAQAKTVFGGSILVLDLRTLHAPVDLNIVAGDGVDAG